MTRETYFYKNTLLYYCSMLKSFYRCETSQCKSIERGITVMNKKIKTEAVDHLFEAIRIGASLLEPIMPKTAQSIYKQINTELSSFEDILDLKDIGLLY